MRCHNVSESSITTDQYRLVNLDSVNGRCVFNLLSSIVSARIANSLGDRDFPLRIHDISAAAFFEEPFSREMFA